MEIPLQFWPSCIYPRNTAVSQFEPTWQDEFPKKQLWWYWYVVLNYYLNHLIRLCPSVQCVCESNYYMCIISICLTEHKETMSLKHAVSRYFTNTVLWESCWTDWLKKISSWKSSPSRYSSFLKSNPGCLQSDSVQTWIDSSLQLWFKTYRTGSLSHFYNMHNWRAGNYFQKPTFGLHIIT